MSEIVVKSARLSPCGLYRYELERDWSGPHDRESVLVSMGLNPSTADAERDDATIRKDIGFARRWGLGRVVKLNASAYRARDPKAVKRAAKSGIDVVGPDNDRTIRACLTLLREPWVTVPSPGFGSARLVVSWGANIDAERQLTIGELIHDAGVTAWCLGTNDDGTPVHELYQPYDRVLVPWMCPTVAHVLAARKACKTRPTQRSETIA